MKLDVKPGEYVVAVSGGLDSMALLHMLQKHSDLELIVAHFDHNVRGISQQDRKFVEDYAKSHNMTFAYEVAKPGSLKTEDQARRARYKFLRTIRERYNANAIMTAHHYDDLLETVVINLIRGTGRRGLAPFTRQSDILRPLLDLGKKQLVEYAKQYELEWREDATNESDAYLRNIVRRTVLPTLSAQQKDVFQQIIVRQTALNRRIDAALQLLLDDISGERTDMAFVLSRYHLIMLPQAVLYELLQYVLVQATGTTREKKLVQHAMLFCKTAKIGKVLQLDNDWQLRTAPGTVIVEPRLL